jgi:hypothetical protein
MSEWIIETPRGRAGWAMERRTGHERRSTDLYLASDYVMVVLANLDPPAAQRVADYLDARLPLDK